MYIHVYRERYIEIWVIYRYIYHAHLVLAGGPLGARTRLLLTGDPSAPPSLGFTSAPEFSSSGTPYLFNPTLPRVNSLPPPPFLRVNPNTNSFYAVVRMKQDPLTRNLNYIEPHYLARSARVIEQVLDNATAKS